MCFNSKLLLYLLYFSKYIYYVLVFHYSTFVFFYFIDYLLICNFEKETFLVVLFGNNM